MALPTKSLLAKSPLPPHDVVDKQEDFSDLEINDSDEEILNKLNPNDTEEGHYQVKDLDPQESIQQFTRFWYI